MALEICCYASLGFALWFFSTNRIENYECNQISDVYDSLKNFVQSGGKEEKVIRIIAANYGLDMFKNAYGVPCIKTYIDKITKDNEYEQLTKLTLKDLRNNCADPDNAKLFPGIYKWLKEAHKEIYTQLSENRSDDLDKLWDIGVWIFFIFAIFIFAPIMVLTKLLQMIYPWIIVGYLGHNKLLFTNKIDSFQMVMLMIYIGLQLILILLGIYVYKIHYLMWHFEIGSTAYWWHIEHDKLFKAINDFYDKCAWFPKVEKIILKRFGSDIGNIIIMYCRSFEIEESEKKVESIETTEVAIEIR